ncbi:hypothetical protein [Acetobacterium sp.]|uniref:hypothetical protein n=1 Tax=Acetobacterium sp. TaxID=1872094 RepID=UPI000CA7E3D5|nr:hypothetical protein [Acetobacterium sp.]MDO9493424.1 hypothetical protein [Acetobacterium sp.]PKM75415.1 MAG: hypothetical protein CVU92_01455 [Firmicutes bacterium HGW-Firmicutes-17]
MKKAMKEKFKRIKVGLLFLIMMAAICFSTSVFAANEVVDKTATTEIGVAYRGHVQNQGNMPKPEGSLVAGPEALGTRGQSLRVEGFWIKLTGNVPEGANIVYEVHVQNEGWMTPVKNGNFAGTAGKSQRVESIKINLENMPGYDVYYRGHVQNVGDTPMVDGEWGWKKNGEELGTTGSSQRLEELQVKIVKQPDTTITYDKAGTYGPKTGVETTENDVVINTPDVVLQNLHIKGNLTIGEGVGEGDVTLNNITVDGETYIRGGGKNSIHINGGDYNKITIQQTSSGQVRIVATNAEGLEVVVSEAAKGEDIILEGAFENVQIDAPDVKISTQGDTTIKEMVVGKSSTGSEITLDKKTTVNKIDLNTSVDMKGEGTIEKANVNSDDVTFEQKPVEETIAPEVKVPPVVTPPTPVKPDPKPTPSGPSAEDLKVAEFNNAKNNVAMVDLLWKNGLGLDLTGFEELDYIGECIVVQTLLDKNGFANKAVIQAAVTEGIKLAQNDVQANAYMEALRSYTPELRAEGNTWTVTYPDQLTAIQKSLLSGLYADLAILVDTPLADGEVLELTVDGITKQVTNRDFNGKEILLSKLLGNKLENDDQVQNQKSTFTITVKDISTKTERYISVCPCTSKNGETYFKNFTNAYAIKLRPFWLEAYSDLITVDYENSEFGFNYAGDLTVAQKQAMDGYYADTVIRLGHPLAAGESIKITGLGKEATLTSSTVMENEDKTEIRLSTLMKVVLNSANLAVNPQSSHKIAFKEPKVDSANYIWAEAVLIRGNAEIINTGKMYGMSIYPTWQDEYKDSVSVSTENSQIVVSYKGKLSPSTVTSLANCQADVIFNLSRELEADETITVSALDNTKTLTKTLTKGMIKGTEIRLSDLLGVTRDAATKLGDDVIAFSTDDLNRNIQIYANPVLIKDNEDVYLNNGTSLSLYQASFKAYSDSLELSSKDNKFLVNYKGGLSPDVQAKLAGYYADAVIYLDRALEEGETVTVKAFNNDDVVISNKSPAEDSGMRSYLLSKLLNIELGDANLAVKQQGSFEIAVMANTLEKQLNVSATAILVKDGDVEYLGNDTGMSINPPGFDAYENSVEILPDNNQGFTITHKGGLSNENSENLAGLYGDTMISFDRPLEVGETIKVSAYGAVKDITSNAFNKWADNRIGLTDLLGVSANKAPLATEQGEDIKISLSVVNLNAPIGVAAWNGLVKGDGTWVYRANTGIGFSISPWFFDAYQNNISLVSDGDKISVDYLDKLTNNEKLALNDFYSDTMICLSRPLADDEKVTINAFGVSVPVDSTMVTDNNSTQIRLSDLLKTTLGVNQLARNQTGGFEIKVTDQNLKTNLSITAEALLVKGDAYYYLNKLGSITLESTNEKVQNGPFVGDATVVLKDGREQKLDGSTGIVFLERYDIVDYLIFEMVNNQNENSLSAPQTVILGENPVLKISVDDVLCEYGNISYVDETHTKIKITPSSEAMATLDKLGYFAFNVPEGTITDEAGNPVRSMVGNYISGTLNSPLLKVTDSTKPFVIGIEATVDGNPVNANKNETTGAYELEVKQNSVTSEIRVKMNEPVTVSNGAKILIPGTETAYGDIKTDQNDSTIVVITPASTGIGTAGKLGLTTFAIPENLVCDLVDNDSSNILLPSSINFTGGGLGNEATSFNLNVLAPDTEKPTMTALTAVLNNNPATKVKATGNPLTLALNKDSLTIQIVVDLNENVTFKNGAISDEGAVVTMSGAGIQEGTIYGKIYREGSIENQLIIEPNGTNGIAGLTGTFTFKVAADTIFDSSNNGNAETSFILEVVDPVV